MVSSLNHGDIQTAVVLSSSEIKRRPHQFDVTSATTVCCASRHRSESNMLETERRIEEVATATLPEPLTELWSG